LPADEREAHLSDRLASERAISFGPFHLLPQRRLLLESDRPVPLGSRALDVLIALLDRPGEVIGRDELIVRVWPATHVDESNLKFQVGALRRALGDGRAGKRFIANVPGRGYSFVAPITLVAEPKPSAPPPATATRSHNLPTQLTRLVGREEIVGKLAARLPRQRFVTIVGTGGIGKTSIALAVGEMSIDAYADGVWLIDLAPLEDPRLVPTALATALGLDIRSDVLLPGLAAALRPRHMLLLLDNCARFVDAAAALAKAILEAAPRVHILATSREPLRVQGEHLYRLPPLPAPPALAQLGAAEALGFPAVQLFVERAVASSGEFELTDANAALVAEICRKLDGLPLAIEFAAARIDALGVRGLVSSLDDRLRLLTSGRRGTPPRHRTIRAMLDWSYDILSVDEQTVFRRLGVFAGGFTFDAATAAAADADRPEIGIADLVAELVEKSLVTAEASEPEPRLRLLDTARAYALAKLNDSGEVDAVARRHAMYYRDLLETVSGDAATAGVSARIASELDNLRAALGWAFSAAGDAAIGAALAGASAGIWFGLSLWTECHLWAGRALGAMGDLDRGTRKELALQYAFGSALMFTRGLSDQPGRRSKEPANWPNSSAIPTIGCARWRRSRPRVIAWNNSRRQSI
jgi:predicted ATPase/DNA-binding winged helix-turn-helix (wHTH) protein